MDHDESTSIIHSYHLSSCAIPASRRCHYGHRGICKWHSSINVDSAALTKGATLSWAEDGFGTDEVIGRAFTSQSLAIGETIRLSFDWTQSVSSVGLIRVGLHENNTSGTSINEDWGGTNSAGTGAFEGYYSFIRDNSSSSNTARFEAATNADSDTRPTTTYLSGDGAATIGTSANQVDLDNSGSITYRVNFDVTYVSATQVDTLFSIFDGASMVNSIAGSTSSHLQTTFDSAFIRSSGGTMTLDNLSVVVIPEPSSFLLIGFAGLAAVIGLRRRHR